jgi:hypothetical protein
MPMNPSSKNFHDIINSPNLFISFKTITYRLEQYLKHRASESAASLPLFPNNDDQSIDFLDSKPPAALSVSQSHIAPAPASYIIATPTRQLKNLPATTCGDSSTISVADESIVEIVQGKPDTNTLDKSGFSYDSYDFYSDNTLSDANSDNSPIVSSRKLEPPRLSESYDSDDVPNLTLKKDCLYHNTQKDDESFDSDDIPLTSSKEAMNQLKQRRRSLRQCQPNFENTRMMNNVEGDVEEDDDESFYESSLDKDGKGDAESIVQSNCTKGTESLNRDDIILPTHLFRKWIS